MEDLPECNVSSLRGSPQTLVGLFLSNATPTLRKTSIEADRLEVQVFVINADYLSELRTIIASAHFEGVLLPSFYKLVTCGVKFEEADELASVRLFVSAFFPGL